MSPYLRDQDILWVETSLDFAYGQLILARRKETGESVVHRVVLDRSLKGDRVKQSDDELPGGIAFSGTIRGRVCKLESGHPIRWVPYGRKSIKCIHRLQAWLSHFNRWRHPILSRTAVSGLILIGWLTRIIEDHFLAEQWKEK